MINSLSSLKMILPVFAVSAGISMFILLCSLLSLITVIPEKNSLRSGMLYGPDPNSILKSHMHIIGMEDNCSSVFGISR